MALLFRRLGETAVRGDPQELEDFQVEMMRIHDRLTPDLPQEDILILAGSATHASETYNRRITLAIERQGKGFQTIVKMLQSSMAAMMGESVESVQTLSKIGEALESSRGFKDLGALKLHLGECLVDLKKEIEREKSSSRAMVSRLQIEVEKFRGSGPESIEVAKDATTGLPRQDDCLSAFHKAIDKGTRHYAMVMAVNRVQAVNARFGREAGDQMLARFKAHIEPQIVAPDELFRWTGPAMVAILERPHSLAHVRVQANRMLNMQIEESFLIKGRSVLIPINASWSLFELTSAEDVEKQIQTFIASQGGRDFA
ncbi:MAG: GGDEF domain-containing protein [Terriglobia bacterium]